MVKRCFGAWRNLESDPTRVPKSKRWSKKQVVLGCYDTISTFTCSPASTSFSFSLCSNGLPGLGRNEIQEVTEE